MLENIQEVERATGNRGAKTVTGQTALGGYPGWVGLFPYSSPGGVLHHKGAAPVSDLARPERRAHA